MHSQQQSLPKFVIKNDQRQFLKRKKKITESKLMSQKFNKEYKSYHKNKIDYVKDKLFTKDSGWHKLLDSLDQVPSAPLYG